LYLDDLYVKEEYRGKGVGQSFFDALITEAKQSGCKKMRWQVSRWNEKAIQFYKHIGATIDDVELNCDLTFGEK
jgi:diamine N-acetyltransferase